VSVGAELPVLEIPLTRTLIVATAIASRDYQDVHHDPGLAVERGSKDIFMNILSTNGFVGRFVTDWAGPDAQLPRGHHDADRQRDREGRRDPDHRDNTAWRELPRRPRDRHGRGEVAVSEQRSAAEQRGSDVICGSARHREAA
jgi:hypothetical protein